MKCFDADIGDEIVVGGVVAPEAGSGSGIMAWLGGVSSGVCGGVGAGVDVGRGLSVIVMMKMRFSPLLISKISRCWPTFRAEMKSTVKIYLLPFTVMYLPRMRFLLPSVMFRRAKSPFS